ncbi:MAG: glutaredoxin domain-containing protein [Acidiferrobacter sp.]
MNRVIIGALFWGLVGCAQATTLYRWVNPEGVVTYQNSPPPQSAGKVKVMHLRARSSSTDVRKAVSAMQPVILYEAPHCVPCKAASTYLAQRKVPFKSIDVASGQAELRAMKKKTGSVTVPTLMVGKHVLVGYLQSILAEELTAAGYPPVPKK